MVGSDLGQREQRDHAVEAQKYLDASEFVNTHYVAVCPDNQLYVDIDTPYGEWGPSEKFVRALEILQQQYCMPSPPTFTVEMSKGGNTHVIVDLPYYVHISVRVAWQAVLGGDPVREACHLLSISRYEENPIILFRKKEAQRLLTDGR